MPLSPIIEGSSESSVSERNRAPLHKVRCLSAPASARSSNGIDDDGGVFFRPSSSLNFGCIKAILEAKELLRPVFVTAVVVNSHYRFCQTTRTVFVNCRFSPT